MKIYRCLNWNEVCYTDMNRRQVEIIVLLLGFATSSFAQNVKELLQNPEKYSFEEFNSIEDSIEKINFKLYSDVIEIHEKEAFNRKDTLEIIKTHLWNVWELDKQTALNKFNFVLSLSNSKDYVKYHTTILHNLGVYHYNELNDPVVALDYFIQSLKLADQFNYFTLITDNLNSIASIKSEYLQERQAIFLLNYSLNFATKNKRNIENYPTTYAVIVDNLAKTYLSINKIDSARYYCDIGLQYSKTINEKYILDNFITLNAKIDFYDGIFFKSRDTLVKYLKFGNDYEKLDSYFYLSQIGKILKGEEEEIKYLLKYDSILNLLSNPPLEQTFKVYNKLLDYNNYSNKEFMKKFIFYDSLRKHQLSLYEKISNDNFDIPFLKREFNFTKKKYADNFILILICLLILGFIIIRTKGIKTIKKIKTLNHDNQIIIHQKLIDWEEQKGFLEKMTLNDLAKKLETNSSYLSLYFKNRNTTYKNYIYSIRCNWLISLVEKDPSLLKKKSTIQLAEMTGFNSIDAFNNAFKTCTGKTFRQNFNSKL